MPALFTYRALLKFFMTVITFLLVLHPHDAQAETENNKLTRLTEFLAGRGHHDNSSRIRAFSREPVYKRYSRQIQKRWRGYREFTLDKLKKWRRENVEIKKTDTVFYPFSGPDLPNLVAAFPENRHYVLIGLEKAGLPADLDKLTPLQMAKGILTVNQAVRTPVHENFFYTVEMKQNVSGNRVFTGTTHILLTYMGLMNFKPLQLRAFTVDYNGRRVYLKSSEVKKQTAVSVQIIAADTRGRRRTIEYLQIDLADSRYISKNPGAFLYLEQFKPYQTFIKASSYLLHLRNYRTLKEEILTSSSLLFMDDTGIKYSDLKDDFSVKVYGEYKGTIPLFKNRFQSDLEAVFKQQKPEPLPFQYGYGPRPRIIVAVPE